MVNGGEAAAKAAAQDVARRELRFPDQRERRKASGAEDIELDAAWWVCLAEGELRLGLAARRQIGQRGLLLFQGDGACAVIDGAHGITTKRIARNIAPRFYLDTEGI